MSRRSRCLTGVQCSPSRFVLVRDFDPSKSYLTFRFRISSYGSLFALQMLVRQCPASRLRQKQMPRYSAFNFAAICSLFANSVDILGSRNCSSNAKRLRSTPHLRDRSFNTLHPCKCSVIVLSSGTTACRPAVAMLCYTAWYWEESRETVPVRSTVGWGFQSIRIAKSSRI